VARPADHTAMPISLQTQLLMVCHTQLMHVRWMARLPEVSSCCPTSTPSRHKRPSLLSGPIVHVTGAHEHVAVPTPRDYCKCQHVGTST